MSLGEYVVSSDVFLSVVFVLLGVSLLAVGWAVFAWDRVERGVSSEPAEEDWFSTENERLELVVAGELLRIESLVEELDGVGFAAPDSGLWSEYAKSSGRSSGVAATHGELLWLLGEAQETRLRLEGTRADLMEGS